MGQCAPMLPPPPPPPVRVAYTQTGGVMCLGTNVTFPCIGGWGDSCPAFLVPCASPTAAWFEHAGTGFLESVAHPGNCLNRDCNGCSGGTVLKVLACEGNASPIPFAGGELTIEGCNGMCVSNGSGVAPFPPCKAGEQTALGQLTVEACTSGSAQGWVRSVV